MKTVREQYDIQLRVAQTTANFYNIPLHIVMVKHRDKSPTRISIIGNAISFSAIDIWRSMGSQVRTIKIVEPARS